MIVTLEIYYSVVFGTPLKVSGMFFRLASYQDALICPYHGGTDRIGVTDYLRLQCG